MMEIEGVTYSTELVEAFLQVKGKKDVLDLPRYWLEQHLITFKEGYDLGCVNKNGVADIGRLWTKEGLPVAEVDIYLLGEVPGRKQLTQVHSFAVGDKYKLLPEDEEPVSTYYNYNLGEAEDEVDDWKIQDIRAHAYMNSRKGS